MPPPEPPSVKLGRSTQGRPTSSRIARASSRLWASPLWRFPGRSPPCSCLNSSRSSALRIASALAPIRLAAVALQRPLSARASADVQAGLTAQRRQHGVRLLDGDDLLDDFGRDRLDIGAVGHLGVGHDGGRVRVDQDDLVTFLAKGLARLGARVVELARLADDDRPCADDQDLLDIGTLGHGRSLGGASRGNVGGSRVDFGTGGVSVPSAAGRAHPSRAARPEKFYDSSTPTHPSARSSGDCEWSYDQLTRPRARSKCSAQGASSGESGGSGGRV